MSQVNTVGRVTADFELQMSANNVPYVRFSLVENIGYGESRKPQYLQVWAYGEDAARQRKGACFGSAENWNWKSSSIVTKPKINGSKSSLTAGDSSIPKNRMTAPRMTPTHRQTALLTLPIRY